VLWNPGAEIAQGFPDFPDDGWPGMVCFESGAIRSAAPRVEPGDTHSLAVTVAVDMPLSPTD
jgi:glucose-6-phosphate 1-epimerase